jgi:hypothetical protein
MPRIACTFTDRDGDILKDGHHMRITFRLLAALAMLFATPSLSTAQERQGFWIGAGVVMGSAALRCDTCGDGRDVGGGLNIRAGWTATERLLIGGEFHGVATFGEVNLLTPAGALLEEDVPATFFLHNFLGTVTFYPSASSGFFLKGGAGVSGVSIQIDYPTSYLTIRIGNGLGVLVGAGYDLRVGRRISVTQAVNFSSGRLGTVEGAPGQGRTWKHNVVDFTVGVTFH